MTQPQRYGAPGTGGNGVDPTARPARPRRRKEGNPDRPKWGELVEVTTGLEHHQDGSDPGPLWKTHPIVGCPYSRSRPVGRFRKVSAFPGANGSNFFPHRPRLVRGIGSMARVVPENEVAE